MYIVHLRPAWHIQTKEKQSFRALNINEYLYKYRTKRVKKSNRNDIFGYTSLCSWIVPYLLLIENSSEMKEWTLSCSKLFSSNNLWHSFLNFNIFFYGFVQERYLFTYKKICLKIRNMVTFLNNRCIDCWTNLLFYVSFV